MKPGPLTSAEATSSLPPRWLASSAATSRGAGSAAWPATAPRSTGSRQTGRAGSGGRRLRSPGRTPRPARQSSAAPVPAADRSCLQPIDSRGQGTAQEVAPRGEPSLSVIFLADLAAGHVRRQHAGGLGAAGGPVPCAITTLPSSLSSAGRTGSGTAGTTGKRRRHGPPRNGNHKPRNGNHKRCQNVSQVGDPRPPPAATHRSRRSSRSDRQGGLAAREPSRVAECFVIVTYLWGNGPVNRPRSASKGRAGSSAVILPPD